MHNLRRSVSGRRMVPAAAALTAFLSALTGPAGFSGCSLDYSEGELSESMDREIPRSELETFVHTRVTRGQPRFVLGAHRARIYDDPDETLLEKAVFKEYGENGELLSQGKADRIVFQNSSEDARMTGDILVYSAREETRIAAQEILWDSDKKQLTSGGETLVSLLQNDGTKLEGRGFKADFRYNTFEFSQGVEGTYRPREEEEP